jgi:hypothetical protein
MKKNFTLKFSLRSMLMVLLFTSFSQVSAQPDYTFNNHVHESGTDLLVGAVYRFYDVKPGVDALVTITDLNKISLSELDGASGFDEAFQPYIFCAGKTKGYVEFRIDFVNAGTSTPAVMVEVPMTAIDIDGYEFPDEKLYEFDMFEKSPSFYVDYDLLGSNLSVNTGGPWVEAMNTSAITYDGIDTVQKDVMISMVHANVSSVMLRVGVDNKSKTDMMRLRSVYFKKFNYPSSILNASALASFSGYAKSNGVNLQWNLNSNHSLYTVVVEKSTNSGSFIAIGEVTVKGYSLYSFTDNAAGSVNYYRLKMIAVGGKVEYSQVLVFKTGVTGKEIFKVYPSLVNEHATVSVSATGKEASNIRIADISGRLVYQQTISLEAGINTFSVDGLTKLRAGTYVAMVGTGTQVYTQKIIKQ